MQPARPTLRALREDLKLPLPSAREPLDELDHPTGRQTTSTQPWRRPRWRHEPATTPTNVSP